MTRPVQSSAAPADADVFAAARRALDHHPEVPPEVRIHVEHGHLTLTGSVRWPAEREAAANIVRQIPGVETVVNDIVVAEMPSAAGLEPPQGKP